MISIIISSNVRLSLAYVYRVGLYLDYPEVVISLEVFAHLKCKASSGSSSIGSSGSLWLKSSYVERSQSLRGKCAFFNLQESVICGNLWGYPHHFLRLNFSLHDERRANNCAFGLTTEEKVFPHRVVLCVCRGNSPLELEQLALKHVI